MIRVDPARIASRPAPAAADLVERQLALLTRLAEMGMEIAEAATRQATASPAATSAGAADAPVRGDPALAYTRVARAVRLTIALQSRLLADLAAQERAEAAAEAARTGVRQARLRRLVQRALEADHPDAADHEIEGLWEDARERLAEAEDEAELSGRPFAEVVARICDDLGLSPDRAARIVAAAAAEDGPRAPPRPHAPHAEQRPSGRASKHARPRAPPH